MIVGLLSICLEHQKCSKKTNEISIVVKYDERIQFILRNWLVSKPIKFQKGQDLIDIKKKKLNGLGRVALLGQKC